MCAERAATAASVAATAAAAAAVAAAAAEAVAAVAAAAAAAAVAAAVAAAAAAAVAARRVAEVRHGGASELHERPVCEPFERGQLVCGLLGRLNRSVRDAEEYEISWAERELP